MKRILVFTVLFPPLTLIVYVAADQLLREGLPNLRMIMGLMVIAYALAIIPAWITAGADWALSGRPLYLRIILTVPVAAITTELVARYMGQPSFDLSAAIAGAIPAALCSRLSDKPLRPELA